ncbi:MAG: hydrogenase maturation nickel metallochaperone HypA [Flavisolibacter sp.]
MHELSIVMSIVEMAADETRKAGASEVESIELEIGNLSGVEMNSFDFAWQQAVPGTLLQGAERTVHRVEGKGKCLECGTAFKMENHYDACPLCDSHFVQISSGKELRVKSLTVH